jgi:hypothetical protein
MEVLWPVELPVQAVLVQVSGLPVLLRYQLSELGLVTVALLLRQAVLTLLVVLLV